MKTNITPSINLSAVFFPNQKAFRAWLQRYHQVEKELLVGYYKVKTDKPSMTWSESVDQALCFGWIDGIRRSIDDERYCIRFTPRKPGSTWSAVNIAKVEALIKSGQMKPAGLALYMKRNKEKTTLYSFENEQKSLPAEMEKDFKKNKEAWEFFTAQPPSYRKTVTFWIVSAKQEKTKVARLEQLIEESKQKRRLFATGKSSK